MNFDSVEFRAGRNICLAPPGVKVEREIEISAEIKPGLTRPTVRWFAIDLRTREKLGSGEIDVAEAGPLAWLRGLDEAVKWVRSHFETFVLRVGVADGAD